MAAAATTAPATTAGFALVNERLVADGFDVGSAVGRIGRQLCDETIGLALAPGKPSAAGTLVAPIVNTDRERPKQPPTDVDHEERKEPLQLAENQHRHADHQDAESD